MPIRDEDGHRAMQAAGKAWKAIKTSGAKTWREWTEVIGPGLVNARAEAQSISNASSGKGYNAAMGALLEEYGFGNALERHRSQVTRADLLRCMDYLTEIEKWRHDAKASVLLSGNWSGAGRQGGNAEHAGRYLTNADPGRLPHQLKADVRIWIRSAVAAVAPN